VYIPPVNREHDRATLFALIQAYPFATWACQTQDSIEINHIPFHLRRNEGKNGVLVGHVARANPIWKHCDGKLDSTIVFHGEHAYITPSWYPSKQNDPRVVPTWNYVVVHAQGKAKAIEDGEWLLQHLNELTIQQEKSFDKAWEVSDAPHTFIEKLSKAIVGIEIPIDALEGKWKLGQNRSESDQIGLIKGLRSQGSEQAISLANKLSKVLENNS
jgi:transcriptional regulator